ncbi:MAG: DUF1302 domain-containing protein [Opitutae bacterium]|nr:DUF1302 domain-containing protein [Opitutae bacterium]
MNLRKSYTSCLRWQAAAALTSALFFTSAAPAFVFQYGDVKGSFDTTLSVGALARLNPANPDYLGTTDIVGGRQKSSNNDDGDLNYRSGIASFLLKASHELQVNYKQAGFFVRGYYFNDLVNTNGQRQRTALSDEALKIVGQRAELLDAYLYFKPTLGSLPASIRVGRQVLSWGESTFIPNGINSINPIDVAKLRTPGSELKEALLPLNMVSGSVNLTDAVTLEAFYLLDWERTRVDPPGTYFSTNDFVAKGGEKVFLGFGSIPDTSSFGFVRRGGDREPSKSNQWGTALRYLASGLNDTEFGLYYITYASRLPVISAVTPTSPINVAAAPALIGALVPSLVPGFIAQGQDLATATNSAIASATATVSRQLFFQSVATSRYLIEFPEDISVTGLSFNTSVKGIALQGEISYRKGQPLQIDDVELLFAALSSINPAFGPNNQIGNFLGQLNTRIPGFRRFNTYQGQITATKVGRGIFGAQQSTFLAEAGFVSVPDLPDKNTLRFDGPGTTVGGNLAAMIATGNGAFGSEPSTAFANKFSWGYQLVGRLDYNNAYKGVNISPLVVFSHDVTGNTPLPIGNFIKNRKSLTIGTDFTFQNAWSFEVRYVNFFGAGRFNLLGDRDYVSANLRYSF